MLFIDAGDRELHIYVFCRRDDRAQVGLRSFERSTAFGTSNRSHDQEGVRNGPGTSRLGLSQHRHIPGLTGSIQQSQNEALFVTLLLVLAGSTWMVASDSR
jgi:hypothetical protein